MGSNTDKLKKKARNSEAFSGVSTEKQEKIRIPLYLNPQTLNQADAVYKSDNCASRTEFIEKAVLFYLGYLNEEKNVNYLSPMITETFNASVRGTEQRLSRLLFKVAVEMGKLSHMTAAVNDVDEETLSKLHAMCVSEVRKINGIIDFEDAVNYQKDM